MAAPQDGDDTDMQGRLARLSTSIDTHRKANPPPAEPAGASSPRGMGEAMNLGMRVMTEFVASVVVGGIIGWAIDHWLGTSPGGLIIFVGLGTAAGFWSVYRLATRSSGPLGR